MMVTRSAPVCGLTNPSGPERFRSETHHRDYRTEDAAISSRGDAPAAKSGPGSVAQQRPPVKCPGEVAQYI